MAELKLILNFLSESELRSNGPKRLKTWWRTDAEFEDMMNSKPLLENRLLRMGQDLSFSWGPWNCGDSLQRLDPSIYLGLPNYTAIFMDPRTYCYRNSSPAPRDDILLNEINQYTNRYTQSKLPIRTQGNFSRGYLENLISDTYYNTNYYSSYAGLGFSPHAVNLGLNMLDQGVNVAFIRWLPTPNACLAYTGENYLESLGFLTMNLGNIWQSAFNSRREKLTQNTLARMDKKSQIDLSHTAWRVDDLGTQSKIHTFLKTEWPYLLTQEQDPNFSFPVSWRTGIECDSMLLWLAGGRAETTKIDIIGHGTSGETQLYRKDQLFQSTIEDALKFKPPLQEDPRISLSYKNIWNDIYSLVSLGGDTLKISNILLSKRCLGSIEAGGGMQPHGIAAPIKTELHLIQCGVADKSPVIIPEVRHAAAPPAGIPRSSIL